MAGPSPQGIAQHDEDHDRENQKEDVEYIEQGVFALGKGDRRWPVRAQVSGIAHPDMRSI
jgi:hypothetical protein